jgi:glycosyltransferase involved in cell wall biosynthesis
MKFCYYHNTDINGEIRAWEKGDLPAHGLYGLTCFGKYGVEVVMPPYPSPAVEGKYGRLWYAIKNLMAVLSVRSKYDVFFAFQFRGIELLIFLRALKIYRKPIIVWHHSYVEVPENFIKRIISRIFYKGIDCLLFYHQEFLDISLQTGKVRLGKVVNWGADLDFYDNISETVQTAKKDFFISTGKAKRDIPIIMNAFNKAKENISIYITDKNGENNYVELLSSIEYSDQYINLNIFPESDDMTCRQKSIIAKNSLCVVISLQRTDFKASYGLSSLVEAMAWGKPVIITDNPYLGIDVEKEGFGLKVDYDDVDGWVKAIQYIAEDKERAREMGRRGRELAERKYNLEQCTKELADIFNLFTILI